MRQNVEEFNFRELIATLTRLQGISEKQTYSPVDILQKQIILLKRVITEGLRVRNSEMESIYKKMEVIEDDMNEQLGQAQNFINELDKNLKETERECKKRMQKLEKDRLQSEIQMKTIIDKRILQIIDGNKEVKQMGDVFSQMFGQVAKAEERIRDKLKDLSQILLKLKLELVQTGSINQNKIRQAIKSRQIQTKLLKQKIVAFHQKSRQKIATLRANRCRIESTLLVELQKIAARLY